MERQTQMNTTAAIFFLVLGQADGASTSAYPAGSGGLATIPIPYSTLASCEDAGEAARANNLGLSFLSYTCVPGEAPRQRPVGNYVTIPRASFSAPVVVKPVQVLGPKCLDVCEVQP